MFTTIQPHHAECTALILFTFFNQTAASVTAEFSPRWLQQNHISGMTLTLALALLSELQPHLFAQDPAGVSQHIHLPSRNMPCVIALPVERDYHNFVQTHNNQSLLNYEQLTWRIPLSWGTVSAPMAPEWVFSNSASCLTTSWADGRSFEYSNTRLMLRPSPKELLENCSCRKGSKHKIHMDLQNTRQTKKEERATAIFFDWHQVWIVITCNHFDTIHLTESSLKLQGKKLTTDGAVLGKLWRKATLRLSGCNCNFSKTVFCTLFRNCLNKRAQQNMSYHGIIELLHILKSTIMLLNWDNLLKHMLIAK